MSAQPKEEEAPQPPGTAEEPAVPNPTAESPTEDVDTLRQALEEQRSRAQQLQANWQRAQADYANLKRRVDQERQELLRHSAAAVIATVLPILDDLERALEHADTKLVGLTWVDGIRLACHKLQAILQAHGLQPIQSEGQEFDPRLHEAVLEGEGEDGKVLQELQRGYTLHGLLVRPALVKVGKGQASPPPEPLSEA